VTGEGRRTPTDADEKRGTSADKAEYAEWATAMIAKVADTVGQLHERGVVFCDLHPTTSCSMWTAGSR
jgi:hypothetical protein